MGLSTLQKIINQAHLCFQIILHAFSLFFQFGLQTMTPLFRTWQLGKHPYFGLSVFVKQRFRICNLSVKPYQIKCLFPPKYLQASGLLPQLLVEVLAKDFSQESSKLIQMQLQNLRNRLQQAHTLDRDREQLHFNFGACLILQQRYEEAINQIRKAWQINKSDPNYCIQIAVCLMEGGKFFDAIKLLERQLLNNPNDSNLYHHLAIAYLNVENYKETILNFYKSCQIEQDISIEFINRGQQLIKVKKYIEAIPFYLKRMIHQRHNENVINTLKDCFIQENQLEKAFEVYEALREVKQFQETAEYSLALLYFQTGQIQQALPHLETSVSQNPENYQLNLYLATAYFKQARLQDAKKHYINCLKTRSYDNTAYSSLAMVYMRLKQLNKAEQLYQKSLQINDKCSMSWYGYGLIHFQRKNIAQGIKSLENAIVTDEQNYLALEKLGSTYILLGEVEKGKKLLLKAQGVKKDLKQN